MTRQFIVQIFYSLYIKDWNPEVDNSFFVVTTKERDAQKFMSNQLEHLKHLTECLSYVDIKYQVLEVKEVTTTQLTEIYDLSSL